MLAGASLATEHTWTRRGGRARYSRRAHIGKGTRETTGESEKKRREQERRRKKDNNIMDILPFLSTMRVF